MGIALPERPQQLGHPQAHHRVHVVAAGVHQSLVHRGVIQAGALFYRQGIHVHPQGHQGHPGPRRTQLSQHPGAAHAFAHLPTPAAQFTRHQGGRLLLVATELGVAVDVAPQLNQLGQGLLKGLIQPQALPAHHDSKAKNCSRAATGLGGQRRVFSNHSPWL